MQNVLLNLHIIDVLQMTELFQLTFFFNKQETKYILDYLNDDFNSQVKNGSSSGHVVLNDIQLFILVTFESNIPKNEVHALDDPRHTLSMCCGRYIRITS
jgi:hypothetical protein